MRTILLALGVALALPTSAAPLEFDYSGKTLRNIQRHGVKTEMISRNLEVITETGLEGPKIAWVLHQDELVRATVAVWPGDCQTRASAGAPYSKERRGNRTLTLVRDAGATLVQWDGYCWVAYGDKAVHQPLLDALTQVEPDQAFPHRDKPRGLVQSLASLREALRSPFAKSPRPSWKGLTAGQATATPEQAALQLGFTEVKVTNRQAAHGTGYLLKCGDGRSKGQLGVMVLSADGAAIRQFSALLSAERARDELARLSQELGEPATEEHIAGQLKYRWFNPDYQTVLQQMPEGDWLFMWRPGTGPQGPR